jgi:outer membrane protein assembly factor BamB
MCAPAVGEVNGVPVVLVGTMGRRVYCLSAKDGARLWGYDVGAQIRYAAPLLVPPVAFIATGPPENGLYCVTATGPRAKDRGWHGPWKDLTINQ